ncbi:MAG: hypothetical protein IJA60_07440 [Clostridia bacterium]|nr:hypothetical protein [Clostridia bacterium]
MIYRIADINIEMHFLYPINVEFFAEYSTPYEKEADFAIEVTEAEIDFEAARAEGVEQPYIYTRGYFERLAILRKVSAMMLTHDGFLMHGTTVEYEGRGYIFAAPSGVGKTTHALLWKKCFGEENVKIINGDKPFVRLFDGRFYAYGTPWCGKEGLSINERTPIAAVCFLKRATENSIRPLDETESLQRMLAQIMVTDSSDLATQLDLAGALIENVPMFELACNMEIEAAQVAYEGMNKRK